MSVLNKKPRIIVLEDDRASRKLLSMMLEKAGYDVDQCGEGRYAIEMATLYPPAAMVVDVMLPDMTGIEVVDELNSHPNCRFIKKIFLTGLLSKKTNEIESKFSFEVGGKHFRALAKPFKKKVLLSLVADAIAASEAERKEYEDKLAEEGGKDQRLQGRATVERTDRRNSDVDSDAMESAESEDVLEELENSSMV